MVCYKVGQPCECRKGRKMGMLKPDWNQPRPTWEDTRDMGREIQLMRTDTHARQFDEFVASLKKSHRNGGAQLAAFDVGENLVFDWFASRNRLYEIGVLDALLTRPTVREALPELRIPDSFPEGTGFDLRSSFTLDGDLAHALYHGGAYHKKEGDGRKEKELALAVCEAMFVLRFGEVSRFSAHGMWTPWFHDIAWDNSDVVFDHRLRRLWLIAITDTD